MEFVSLEIDHTLLNSTNQISIKISETNIRKPTILNGITLRTVYKNKKYHSGIIWEGVINLWISKLLSGCEKLYPTKKTHCPNIKSTRINVKISLLNTIG